jgi:hypothetical protein
MFGKISDNQTGAFVWIPFKNQQARSYNFDIFPAFPERKLNRHPLDTK